MPVDIALLGALTACTHFRCSALIVSPEDAMRRLFFFAPLLAVVFAAGCHPAVTRSCNKAEECGEISDASECIEQSLNDLDELQQNCGDAAVKASKDLMWCGGGLECSERTLFGGGFGDGGDCEEEFTVYINTIVNCN